MKKLRNKETGEIGELQITAKHYAVVVGNGTANCNAKIYCSLDKLNQEWEDYKEPKKYWYINPYGVVELRTEEEQPAVADRHKQFGNYFETREEVEQAVEKLKAWKRLKECGFRFCGHDDRDRGQLGDIVIYAEMPTFEYDDDSTRDDLELLFGGEE